MGLDQYIKIFDYGVLSGNKWRHSRKSTEDYDFNSHSQEAEQDVLQTICDETYKCCKEHYRHGYGEDLNFWTAYNHNVLFWCWRKHANLQGYMESYAQKCGLLKRLGGDFNCKYLEVTTAMLDDLEPRHHALPHAIGFFWGESNDYDVKSTEQFIKAARAALTLKTKNKKPMFRLFYQADY